MKIECSERMKTQRLILVLGLSGLVAACGTTHNTAPVVEKPLPGKSAAGTKPPPAPVVARAPMKADEHGFYTVKKGDTLLHIALEFGQNYRDVVAWNNLADPNDIKVDQVLRVLPPESNGNAGVQVG